MNILTGLFDHMVMQRNARGVSDQAITGEIAAAGRLSVRIRAGGRVTERGLGRVAPGTFAVRLKGLPTGGPYQLELRVTDRARQTLDALPVRDVLVGDVWVLAGQSNMEGCGQLKYALKPHPRIRNFYMSDTWAVAKDPLHGSWSAVDAVHHDLGVGYTAPVDPVIGSGLALAFGRRMLALTGVPQGFIACAHGGTSMTTWDPALKEQGGKSLYGAMVRRVQKNGGRVAGVLWHQGCSETAVENQPVYTDRMRRLVAAMRADFAGPALPVVMAQIARFVYCDQMTDGSGYMAVRELQRRLPEAIPHLAVVPTIDLPIDDIIHLAGDGLNVLGGRMADVMRHLTSHGKAGRRPLALRGLRVEPARRGDPWKYKILVDFSNVAGGLQAPGRPTGFHVASGGQALMHYDTRLEGDSVALYVEAMQGVPIKDVALSYGYGLNPYCNITDAENHSLPAFGPLPLAWPG